MEKKLIVLVIMLLPWIGISQNDIFAKYSENPDVTYVSIKPKMFQMIAKMGINVEGEEAKAYMDMVKSITSFKTIVTDNKAVTMDVSKWVKWRSGDLEELMEAKDNGTKVKFYVKEGKDVDHVKELLIFVNGTDGIKLVAMSGDINLNEVYKLTRKMNIPGGKHLEKAN